MSKSSSIPERGASKIRFGTQLLHQSHLRQRLMKEISELEARMDVLERSQDKKHNATLDSYRNMMLERLEILRDLLANQ
jgi:hypothetical protein